MDNGSHQAFQILRLGFTVAPIIAGLDKFLQILTNWDKYVAPAVPATLGIAPHTFMMIVGVIEIAAGLLVAVKPRFGGYLVSAWLVGIIVNLLLVGGYLDVALRDLGLAMGAFALARLAEADERIRVVTPARA
jgi:uncharacterized membrane protein YphA (DoxX/SURF4 family)